MAQPLTFKAWMSQGGRFTMGAVLAAVILGGWAGFLSGRLGNKQGTVAYVRTHEVMARYKAAIQARETFQKETSAWGDEVRSLEGDLQAKAKGANLSDPKVRENLGQIRSRIEALKEKGARRDQELMQPVLAEVNSRIKKFAQKHGYRLVLGTLQGGVILHGDDELDVTDALITELNQ